MLVGSSHHGGIKKKGAFEPIISVDLFNAVQDLLAKSRSTHGGRKFLENADFPLRVFVKCFKCGKGLTGSKATGRSGKRYPHYFCRTPGCRAVKFTKDQLHHIFHRFLYSLFPDEHLMPLFEEVVRDVWRQKHVEWVTSSETGKLKIAAIQAKRQRIMDLLIGGQIDKVAYDEQWERVGTALKEAQSQLKGSPLNEDQVEHLLVFARWLLVRAAGIWSSASLTNKLRLQAALFPQGLTIDKEGFGTVQLPLFFRAFQEIPVEQKEWRPQGDSNPCYRRERAVS